MINKNNNKSCKKTGKLMRADVDLKTEWNSVIGLFCEMKHLLSKCNEEVPNSKESVEKSKLNSPVDELRNKVEKCKRLKKSGKCFIQKNSQKEKQADITDFLIEENNALKLLNSPRPFRYIDYNAFARKKSEFQENPHPLFKDFFKDILNADSDKKKLTDFIITYFKENRSSSDSIKRWFERVCKNRGPKTFDWYDKRRLDRGYKSLRTLLQESLARKERKRSTELSDLVPNLRRSESFDDLAIFGKDEGLLKQLAQEIDSPAPQIFKRKSSAGSVLRNPVQDLQNMQEAKKFKSDQERYAQLRRSDDKLKALKRDYQFEPNEKDDSFLLADKNVEKFRYKPNRNAEGLLIIDRDTSSKAIPDSINTVSSICNILSDKYVVECISQESLRNRNSSKCKHGDSCRIVNQDSDQFPFRHNRSIQGSVFANRDASCRTIPEIFECKSTDQVCNIPSQKILLKSDTSKESQKKRICSKSRCELVQASPQSGYRCLECDKLGSVFANRDASCKTVPEIFECKSSDQVCKIPSQKIVLKSDTSKESQRIFSKSRCELVQPSLQSGYRCLECDKQASVFANRDASCKNVPEICECKSSDQVCNISSQKFLLKSDTSKESQKKIVSSKSKCELVKPSLQSGYRCLECEKLAACDKPSVCDPRKTQIIDDQNIECLFVKLNCPCNEGKSPVYNVIKLDKIPCSPCCDQSISKKGLVGSDLQEISAQSCLRETCPLNKMSKDFSIISKGSSVCKKDYRKEAKCTSKPNGVCSVKPPSSLFSKAESVVCKDKSRKESISKPNSIGSIKASSRGFEPDSIEESNTRSQGQSVVCKDKSRKESISKPNSIGSIKAPSRGFESDSIEESNTRSQGQSVVCKDKSRRDSKYSSKPNSICSVKAPSCRFQESNICNKDDGLNKSYKSCTQSTHSLNKKPELVSKSKESICSKRKPSKKTSCLSNPCECNECCSAKKKSSVKHSVKDVCTAESNEKRSSDKTKKKYKTPAKSPCEVKDTHKNKIPVRSGKHSPFRKLTSVCEKDSQNHLQQAKNTCDDHHKNEILESNIRKGNKIVRQKSRQKMLMSKATKSSKRGSYKPCGDPRESSQKLVIPSDKCKKICHSKQKVIACKSDNEVCKVKPDPCKRDQELDISCKRKPQSITNSCEVEPDPCKTHQEVDISCQQRSSCEVEPDPCKITTICEAEPDLCKSDQDMTCERKPHKITTSCEVEFDPCKSGQELLISYKRKPRKTTSRKVKPDPCKSDQEICLDMSCKRKPRKTTSRKVKPDPCKSGQDLGKRKPQKITTCCEVEPDPCKSDQQLAVLCRRKPKKTRKPDPCKSDQQLAMYFNRKCKRPASRRLSVDPCNSEPELHMPKNQNLEVCKPKNDLCKTKQESASSRGYIYEDTCSAESENELMEAEVCKTQKPNLCESANICETDNNHYLTNKKTFYKTIVENNSSIVDLCNGEFRRGKKSGPCESQESEIPAILRSKIVESYEEDENIYKNRKNVNQSLGSTKHESENLEQSTNFIQRKSIGPCDLKKSYGPSKIVESYEEDENIYENRKNMNQSLGSTKHKSENLEQSTNFIQRKSFGPCDLKKTYGPSKYRVQGSTNKNNFMQSNLSSKSILDNSESIDHYMKYDDEHDMAFTCEESFDSQYGRRSREASNRIQNQKFEKSFNCYEEREIDSCSQLQKSFDNKIKQRQKTTVSTLEEIKNEKKCADHSINGNKKKKKATKKRKRSHTPSKIKKALKSSRHGLDRKVKEKVIDNEGRVKKIIYKCGCEDEIINCRNQNYFYTLAVSVRSCKREINDKFRNCLQYNNLGDSIAKTRLDLSDCGGQEVMEPNIKELEGYHIRANDTKKCDTLSETSNTVSEDSFELTTERSKSENTIEETIPENISRKHKCDDTIVKTDQESKHNFKIIAKEKIVDYKDLKILDEGFSKIVKKHGSENLSQKKTKSKEKISKPEHEKKLKDRTLKDIFEKDISKKIISKHKQKKIKSNQAIKTGKEKLDKVIVEQPGKSTNIIQSKKKEEVAEENIKGDRLTPKLLSEHDSRQVYSTETVRIYGDPLHKLITHHIINDQIENVASNPESIFSYNMQVRAVKRTSTNDKSLKVFSKPTTDKLLKSIDSGGVSKNIAACNKVDCSGLKTKIKSRTLNSVFYKPKVNELWETDKSISSAQEECVGNETDKLENKSCKSYTLNFDNNVNALPIGFKNAPLKRSEARQKTCWAQKRHQLILKHHIMAKAMRNIRLNECDTSSTRSKVQMVSSNQNLLYRSIQTKNNKIRVQSKSRTSVAIRKMELTKNKEDKKKKELLVKRGANQSPKKYLRSPNILIKTNHKAYPNLELQTETRSIDKNKECKMINDTIKKYLKSKEECKRSNYNYSQNTQNKKRRHEIGYKVYKNTKKSSRNLLLKVNQDGDRIKHSALANKLNLKENANQTNKFNPKETNINKCPADLKIGKSPNHVLRKLEEFIKTHEFKNDKAIKHASNVCNLNKTTTDFCNHDLDKNTTSDLNDKLQLHFQGGSYSQYDVLGTNSTIRNTFYSYELNKGAVSSVSIPQNKHKSALVHDPDGMKIYEFKPAVPETISHCSIINEIKSYSNSEADLSGEDSKQNFYDVIKTNKYKKRSLDKLIQESINISKNLSAYVSKEIVNKTNASNCCLEMWVCNDHDIYKTPLSSQVSLSVSNNCNYHLNVSNSKILSRSGSEKVLSSDVVGGIASGNPLNESFSTYIRGIFSSTYLQEKPTYQFNDKNDNEIRDIDVKQISLELSNKYSSQNIKPASSIKNESANFDHKVSENNAMELNDCLPNQSIHESSNSSFSSAKTCNQNELLSNSETESANVTFHSIKESNGDKLLLYNIQHSTNESVSKQVIYEYTSALNDLSINLNEQLNFLVTSLKVMGYVKKDNICLNETRTINKWNHQDHSKSLYKQIFSVEKSTVDSNHSKEYEKSGELQPLTSKILTNSEHKNFGSTTKINRNALQLVLKELSNLKAQINLQLLIEIKNKVASCHTIETYEYCTILENINREILKIRTIKGQIDQLLQEIEQKVAMEEKLEALHRKLEQEFTTKFDCTSSSSSMISNSLNVRRNEGRETFCSPNNCLTQNDETRPVQNQNTA